jgi:hypothetical protein
VISDAISLRDALPAMCWPLLRMFRAEDRKYFQLSGYAVF